VLSTIEIEEILQLLPHRYPFLLVDKVEIEEDSKKCVGYKNVTINEPFFQGHFPGKPVMPGVLILEAMAQVGAVWIFRNLESVESKLAYFVSMDNVKFRNPVLPGDVLRIEAEVLRFNGRVGKMYVKSFVGEKLAVEAIQTCIISDRE
jgi:beta-hydroxyacyl-ACP dehydratase FabZ